jgi:bifunctional non-homologous end joining protein LigD
VLFLIDVNDEQLTKARAVRSSSAAHPRQLVTVGFPSRCDFGEGSTSATQRLKLMVDAPKKPSRARKAAVNKIAALAPPPNWIEPCLPTLVERPPVGSKWRHEVKWDGYRVCVIIDGGRATVRTRRGHDWTHRFKSIAAAAVALPFQNAILDGEAVVLDEQGNPSFAALQTRLDGESRAEVVLYAFDLLFLDGRDLRPLPLKERREPLVKLIGKPSSGAVLLSEEFETDGATFFKVACERGLEGMISKRFDLPYRSGRSSDWLKVKCVQSDDFLIGRLSA